MTDTQKSLLEEKTVDLLQAPEKIQELYKPIATTAVPYPYVRPVVKAGPDGDVSAMETIIVADDAHPIKIYSDQPYDRVIGELLRNMATPSMLYAQQVLLEQHTLKSEKKFALLLGDPGNGKTELAKMVDRICDSRGAISVDCGGRYITDMLWEQVIDYGEGYKAALTDKIRGGRLSDNSIEMLDELFPDALIKDGGKVTGIDWDKAQNPKVKEEEREDAPKTKIEFLEKKLEYLRAIAEDGGIPPEATNAVGIKKQKGVLLVAWDEGRSVILDEYTKSILGSDNSVQTFLQFCNHEIEEVTVENSLKVSGHDESDSVVLRWSDRKAGFHVTATGNLSSDGISTHDLSVSANSRMVILTTETKTADDWKHRASQIMTGLPLSTWSEFSDPEGFGDAMVEARQKGLTAQELSLVPPDQLTRLKNWEKTNEAIKMAVEGYIFCREIVDPDSDLNRGRPGANEADKAIADPRRAGIRKEISPSFRDRCAIDFRKIIQDNASARVVKPIVNALGKGTGLRFNFDAVAHQNLKPPVDSAEEISAQYGTRFQEALLTRIATTMPPELRPSINATIIEKYKQIGILKSENGPKNTFADLLNQELIAGLGSTKNVFSFRNALIDHLKRVNPALENSRKDEIVSADQAETAYNKMEQLTAASAETGNPQQAGIILLGGDLSTIFNEEAAAVDGIKTNAPATKLVSAADFIETLQISALKDLNMKALWRTTISAEGLMPTSDVATPLVEMAENRHSSGIGVTTVNTRGADGAAVPMHIIADEQRKKYLIVTDQIDSKLKEELSRDNITVVTYGDGSEMQVGNFVREMLEDPSRKSSLAELEEQLIAASLLRTGDESSLQSVKKLMTTRSPAPAAVNLINRL